MFATGEIQLPSGPGAPSVAVGPVEGLRGKLLLVGDYIVQHRKALEGARVTVILPAATADGRSPGVTEASILDRLKREAGEAGIKLEFIFADSLDGLEEALGPFALHEIVTPARAIWLAASCAFVAILLSGWIALRNAPIELAWGPVTVVAEGLSRSLASNSEDATPQRARYDAAADKLDLLDPCFDAQRQHLVIGGETLLVRFSARDGLPFASRLRRPRVFIASVSRAADPVILDANQFHQLQTEREPGAVIDLLTMIPIEPVEDEVALFVVATRDPSVEISTLQEQLRKALQGLSGAAVLTTTASFLQDRLGSEIQYQFKVTNDRRACST